MSNICTHDDVGNCIYCGRFTSFNKHRHPKRHVAHIIFDNIVVCTECEEDIENFWHRKITSFRGNEK